MNRLRVATIHLHHDRDRWRERRRLLVAQIVDDRPDLLSLQGIRVSRRQGAWLRDQINNRLTGGSERPYRLIQQPRRHPLWHFFDGVGILSALPVLYYDVLSLGYGGYAALRANVELPNRRTVDFVAVQLYPEAAGREARQEQAVRLAAWLHEHRPAPRQIVAGDFAEGPEGLAVQHVAQWFRSAYRAAHGRYPLATFPTALLAEATAARCRDYIFLSAAVGRVRQATLCYHRPGTEDETLYPSSHVGLCVAVETAE